ncbi:M20/M25/M40 family metallo-hydrolase [Peptoniphilus catoniae]|uniref:M20/M25/M40 family metallo-hydrolase n=1 Tax=Peptoniphilus catoniae TaxID=1660341 RepID=UPI0010FDA954|nr:M20/M25/M40 family metallo-hydrolase [Peptoniphilus catoniae]
MEIEKIKKLRQVLHANPELSGREVKTKEIVINFLEKNTSLKLVDMGKWFYALHFEGDSYKTIAIRSEIDAISNGEGGAFHGCGHDGHMSILCGLALKIDNENLGKNILLLFQNSEEDGKGAINIAPELKNLNVSKIYGLHNLPAVEKGLALLKEGVFFCASKGMNIDLIGKQSHASTPELGLNPGYLMAELALDLKDLSIFRGYAPYSYKGVEFSDMVLVSLISMDLGTRNSYGVSPGYGNLQLTLRAARDEDLEKLSDLVKRILEEKAKKYKIDFKLSYEDVFPDTSNSKEEVGLLEDIFKKEGIKYIFGQEPYRTSEDFGWYLKKVKGCFFGVGSGEDQPPLHSKNYNYPDDITEDCINIFYKIIKNN